jgi:hypothetical protein
MRGSGGSVLRAIALVGLLLLAPIGTVASGCGDDVPADGATRTAGLPPLADFKLVEVPFDSRVQFTDDRVVWREEPTPDSSGDGTADVVSFDIESGVTSKDEWLSSMISSRWVHEWVLSGDRLAWIGTTMFNEVPGGGGVFLGTRVYTALRDDEQPQAISPLSWGVSGDTGGYEPAAWRLTSNGALITWYGARIELLPDWTDVKVIDPERLWVWDATDGTRHRLPGAMDEQLQALAGRQVVTTVTGDPASEEIVTSTITVRDMATDASRLIENDVPVADPGAADERAFVWTVLAADATDFVDADLAACDLESGEVFTVSDAPGGQTDPAVDGDLVVWVDTPLRPEPIASDEPWALSTLRGKRLSTGIESTLVEDPFTDKTQDSPFNQVTLIGDRLFWTIQRVEGCAAYGAQVVADGDGLKLEPLRD